MSSTTRGGACATTGGPRTRSSVAAWFWIVTALMAACAAPAGAQDFARYSVESVIAIDEFAGENAVHSPQIIIDVSAAMRVGAHWQIYVRPWLRMPRPNAPGLPQPEWDTELYQAGIRYERPGPVATRIDAGYILSPIGLGLYDVRPGVNPTIVTHLGYVVPMPVFDPTGPRVSAVAASYPLGAQLTLSTTKWDARAAVIGSSPTRVYAVGAATNPGQAPIVVAGAGVTPMVGLRLGAAVARGEYATSREITLPVTTGRRMTMTSGEGEWAFAGTKISGEVLRTSFDTFAGTSSIAYEWFVQGQQTVTPRWFAASRYEGTSAPPLVNGIVPGRRTDMQVVEAAAGYRLSPDFTLRGSYYTRRSYGALTWTDQAGVSVVWSRRWW
jgi:hypothetical protein